MSAWYIFSSLGFYPVAPGSNQYIFGAPFLDKVSMRLPGENRFEIVTHQRSEKNKYIQSVRLNGRILDRTWIDHEEIMRGGSLEFFMGEKVNTKWGSSKKSRPYSLSDDPTLEEVKK